MNKKFKLKIIIWNKVKLNNKIFNNKIILILNKYIYQKINYNN